MNRLTIANARILTLSGDPAPAVPRRGAALRDLGVISRGYVRVEGDRIVAVGEGDPPETGSPSDTGALTHPLAPSLKGRGDTTTTTTTIDAAGRVLLPAFVDCHTHACWAGDRFDEFQMRLAGSSYLDILKSGGGIMSTVRAVRRASHDELAQLLLRRLRRMAAMGTATVEVKSGYGLTTEFELKMLRAIDAARHTSPLTVRSTFLGAHAVDPENPRCIEQMINETLPAVAQEFPGITCDAFCEHAAWSLSQTRRLFENAVDLGLPLRVHTDQFTSLGMTRLAVEMGAVSVDHLEAITPKDLEHLARSRTIGVMMPATGFHLDDRYAPGRELIDAGGALAIATNYNPGSAPTPSMPFAIALACRKLRISPAEAISCATINAACVLRLDDELGSIEVGKRADLQLLDISDERELGYELGAPGPAAMFIAGRPLMGWSESQE